MKTPFSRILICIVVGLALPVIAAQAQEQGDASQNSTTGQEQSQGEGAAPAMAEERASAPMLVNGEITSLAFSSELERSNVLRLGIGIGATYDDNASSSPTERTGDFGYSVMPRITLDQARERVRWSLDYAGGFTANQRISQRNQGSHLFDALFEYRLAPHATLHLREQFSLTTGFLDQLQSVGNPVTGTINQPNPSGITPLARHRDNLTSGDIEYQFSASDMIGGGGTFGDVHYSDVVPGSSLVDTRTYSSNSFYSHRITPRNWTGIAYQYQRLNSEPDVQRTTTNSFLLFHTLYLQNHMTFSVFAGPEYSQVESQTVQVMVSIPVVSLAVFDTSRKSWSVSGGASFGWQGEHNSLRFNAVRRVTDGGGILGAVLLNTVNGAYRRQLAPSTAISLGAVYGDNHALGSALSTAQSFDSVSGSVGLEQRLFAKLMLNAGYGRDYQKINTLPAASKVNHNRGWVGVSYNFERPLGR